jgi:tetratricopeptide (TPR) repeat protein
MTRNAAASLGSQSRNALCACGSGRKYKLCCGRTDAGPSCAVAPQPVLHSQSRNALANDPFTEAGRISRSTDLLRRDLDVGHAGPDRPGLSAQGAGAAPRDAKAARVQRQRGLQLLQAGRVADAIGVLRKAVLSDPKDPHSHHALGSALLRNGQFALAASTLSQAVALSPTFALAYQDLGEAFERQGFDLEAMEAYERALALSPKLADLHRRLGNLYEARGNIEQAITHFNRAASAVPDTTAGRLCRARALLLERNLDASEALLRKTLALDRTSGEVHNALANLLVNMGRTEESAAHYDASLRLNPRLFGSWMGITGIKKFTTADQPLLGRMRAALEQDRLNDQDRMILHFALGKAHDDLQDYAKAMQHFDAANAIRGRSLKFDGAGMATFVDRMIQRFTPDLFARLAAYGKADETPLLIVGMPRSGTTLVEQIVTSHPAVTAGDEIPIWVGRGAGLEAVDGPAFTVEAADTLAEEYLALLRRIGPSANRVTDKLPFNFRRLGLIHTLLPNARIIHCRRHPVDTCLSIYSILFKARLDFVGNKADLAFYHQQYARLMDHWRVVLPADRLIEVDYERLIADREAETRRLIAFTGLDWDDACLQPERNLRTVRTASAWQARQPVYTTSVERWRNYEPWLGELRELL